MNIRTLRADEIECRVQIVKESGCSVLLYKDARCDMRILDEVFGPTGWQRDHEVINGNLFCNVLIWDEEKKQWIKKQDVGTESNEEKEKGQASDSFKRACFNLGIGRELYTAPFIWIKLMKDELYKQKNGKNGVKTKFSVSNIEYNEAREIIQLEIKDNKGKIRYNLCSKEEHIDTSKVDSTKIKALEELCNRKGVDQEAVKKYYKINSFSELDNTTYVKLTLYLYKKKDKER